MLVVLAALSQPAPAADVIGRLDGFNIVASRGHPFGSATAARAIERARTLGATALAIVLFLWQASPESDAVVRGNDTSDEDLRRAIRDVRALGMAAIVKPHVWVPGSWAGAVRPANDADWERWFTAYSDAVAQIAAVAAEEKAEALVIGTELKEASERPEWLAVINRIRNTYPGTLLYVAHGVDEAQRITFWPLLDAIGVSLYPELGADDDSEGRLKVMQDASDSIETLAQRFDRPVVVGEIGLRSARGATLKPWESAEERVAPADPVLQAQVLGEWLGILDRPRVRGILIWRWLSDPAAGGPADTDFTVQGKPAEGVLLCAWRIGCAKRWPRTDTRVR